MSKRLYLSPVDIPPYRKGDTRVSYERPEELLVRHNRAIILPNFREAYEAGERTVEVINAEIAPYTLRNMERVTIFIQYKKEFGIIKPIVEHLLPEKVVWVYCTRSLEARVKIAEAGHAKSRIQLAPDVSGQLLADMVEQFGKETSPVRREPEPMRESLR